MVHLLLQLRVETTVRIIGVMQHCKSKDPVVILEEVLLCSDVLGRLLHQSRSKQVEQNNPGELLAFNTNLLQHVDVAEFLEIDLNLDVRSNLVEKRWNAAWFRLARMFSHNGNSLAQKLVF